MPNLWKKKNTKSLAIIKLEFAGDPDVVVDARAAILRVLDEKMPRVSFLSTMKKHANGPDTLIMEVEIFRSSGA